MNKPEIKTEVKKFYDYFECRDYMNEKYKDDERFDEEALWNHVCEYDEIRNDSFYYMSTDVRYVSNDTIAYAKELFEKELGDGSMGIQFYVSW